MDLSKIPNRLRGEPYFCLMKLEKKPSKDKKDKVPYITNGTRADPTNPEHFTSLENVMKVFAKGGYDGIGIGVFDDVIAIDIDHCVEDGKLNDFATEIVETLKTYAEFSISGTGVHIWARAPGLIYDKERYYFNNRAYGLEIYPAGVTTKFIVTTVNAINDYDINECADNLKVILEKYMVRPAPDKPKVDAPGSYLSDKSVIEKMLASKNAEKTKALWEGEIPEGKSHSEADAALCMILAFWCGGDEEQMDRIFRQSALIRDKWDELHGPDTYGNLTIRNAIATEYDKKLSLEAKKPKSWCKSVSAFANILGGALIFGIADNDESVGLEKGSGFGKIIGGYEFQINYDESKKPSFRSDRYQFTVVMPNLNYNVPQDVPRNVPRNVPQKKETNPLEIQILNMIKKDNKISTEKMAMTLGISSKTVKRHIKDIGIVRFIGRGSNGHWEIIDD